MTDTDVQRLAARRQCFFGVTQCSPLGHRCVPVPDTLGEMVDLWLCSCVVRQLCLNLFFLANIYEKSLFLHCSSRRSARY